ncbi:hypothetical protein F5Y15DRAFT_393831 [Xylariaceae sp. FL0016]|nr:hypothetical protein F5Y15DRAFT_393831 [Xylariaceae sp. FL0016]
MHHPSDPISCIPLFPSNVVFFTAPYSCTPPLISIARNSYIQRSSTMTDSPRLPGGFIPPTTSLPSPAPSTASSRIAAHLPRPRSKPLAPGSRKEDYAREYVAQRLLHISRRYVKKHGIPDPADAVRGYDGFGEACRDLDEVVDVLWFSGTPSLQVPYLLNVALALKDYMPSFPPAPRPTFALLRKLDHVFASLLVGRDIKTGLPLPGFQRGPAAGLSRTDMVRCKSLADETRMLVAVVMSGEADVEDDDGDEDRVPGDGEGREGKGQAQKFGGVETVQVEDMEAGEEDSQSSDDVDMSPPPSRKRKAGDMGHDVVEDLKHIRVEDDDETGQAARAKEPNEQDNTHVTNGEQFHFALDDDDDDSDAEQLPNTSNATARDPIITADEPRREDSDVDEEEEEELHMNVAKVYEKTRVQLGASLGESIVNLDD